MENKAGSGKRGGAFVLLVWFFFFEKKASWSSLSNFVPVLKTAAGWVGFWCPPLCCPVLTARRGG